MKTYCPHCFEHPAPRSEPALSILCRPHAALLYGRALMAAVMTDRVLREMKRTQKPLPPPDYRNLDDDPHCLTGEDEE